MSGLASATGLLPARRRRRQRRRSLVKPKRKSAPELAASSGPAPFALKPFAGLFNPYPYGCSVLCNHPADGRAKEVLRRVKDARDGLPEQLETIVRRVGAVTLANLPIPEELFRRYTETDSRPNSPSSEPTSEPATQQGKPSLVVDLRAQQPDHQEGETLTWHAITLENPPAARKAERIIPPCRSNRQIHEQGKEGKREEEGEAQGAQEASAVESLEAESDERSRILRRRGKPLRSRKRRRRRGSTYGPQTEVRQLDEPAETQVSQSRAAADGGDGGDGGDDDDDDDDDDDASSRSSQLRQENASGDASDERRRRRRRQQQRRLSSAGMTVVSNLRKNAATFSFLPADLLSHLCRQLNREKVEMEFSPKRRIALEEALRVMEASGSNLLECRRAPKKETIKDNDAPRFFTRRAVSFEILDSGSLRRGLTPIGYLARHARITPTRLRRYREMFHEFCEDGRGVAPSLATRALSGVLGKALTEEQTARLKSLVGEIEEPLNFAEWCGLCAAAERLLPRLPPRSLDPVSALERADFELLERRLRATAASAASAASASAVPIDPRLAILLREIRDA